MNLQVVVLVSALCVVFMFALPSDSLSQESPQVRGLFDGIINDTINGFLGNLFDPIAIDKLNLNFDNDLLSGAANISAFKLYGIKDLVATVIDVNILTLTLNVTINVPKVLVQTNYYTDLLIANFLPIYGNGLINVTINDINIYVSGEADLSNGVQVSNVSIAFDLGSAVFDVRGLLNNEDFSSQVTEVLNKVVVKLIDEHEQLISEIISPIAQTLINSLLGVLVGGSTSNETVVQEETVVESIVLS